MIFLKDLDQFRVIAQFPLKARDSIGQEPELLFGEPRSVLVKLVAKAMIRLQGVASYTLVPYTRSIVLACGHIASGAKNSSHIFDKLRTELWIHHVLQGQVHGDIVFGHALPCGQLCLPPVKHVCDIQIAKASPVIFRGLADLLGIFNGLCVLVSWKIGCRVSDGIEDVWIKF